MEILDAPISGRQELALLDTGSHADVRVREMLVSGGATTREIHDGLNTAFNFCLCETKLTLERLEEQGQIEQSTTGEWYSPK